MPLQDHSTNEMTPISFAAKHERFPTNLEKLGCLWNDAVDEISQPSCHFSIERAPSYDPWGNRNMGEPSDPKSFSIDLCQDLKADQFYSDFDDVNFHYSDCGESNYSASESDNSHMVFEIND